MIIGPLILTVSYPVTDNGLIICTKVLLGSIGPAFTNAEH